MKDANVYSVEELRFIGDMIEALKILRSLTGVHHDGKLEQANEGAVRSDGAELWQVCSWLNVHSKLFCDSVVRDWNQLSSEI